MSHEPSPATDPGVITGKPAIFIALAKQLVGMTQIEISTQQAYWQRSRQQLLEAYIAHRDHINYILQHDPDLAEKLIIGSSRFLPELFVQLYPNLSADLQTTAQVCLADKIPTVYDYTHLITADASTTRFECEVTTLAYHLSNQSLSDKTIAALLEITQQASIEHRDEALLQGDSSAVESMINGGHSESLPLVWNETKRTIRELCAKPQFLQHKKSEQELQAKAQLMIRGALHQRYRIRDLLTQLFHLAYRDYTDMTEKPLGDHPAVNYLPRFFDQLHEDYHELLYGYYKINDPTKYAAISRQQEKPFPDHEHSTHNPALINAFPSWQSVIQHALAAWQDYLDKCLYKQTTRPEEVDQCIQALPIISPIIHKTIPRFDMLATLRGSVDQLIIDGSIPPQNKLYLCQSIYPLAQATGDKAFASDIEFKQSQLQIILDITVCGEARSTQKITDRLTAITADFSSKKLNERQFIALLNTGIAVISQVESLTALAAVTQSYFVSAASEGLGEGHPYTQSLVRNWDKQDACWKDYLNFKRTLAQPQHAFTPDLYPLIAKAMRSTQAQADDLIADVMRIPHLHIGQHTAIITEILFHAHHLKIQLVTSFEPEAKSIVSVVMQNYFNRAAPVSGKSPYDTELDCILKRLTNTSTRALTLAEATQQLFGSNAKSLRATALRLYLALASVNTQHDYRAIENWMNFTAPKSLSDRRVDILLASAKQTLNIPSAGEELAEATAAEVMPEHTPPKAMGGGGVGGTG